MVRIFRGFVGFGNLAMYCRGGYRLLRSEVKWNIEMFKGRDQMALGGDFFLYMTRSYLRSSRTRLDEYSL